MRIISVVGARPQFVKLAPIARELGRRGIDHKVIHTGQHYDPEMSGNFFRDFSMKPPDYNLAVGSGTHAAQTGAMLQLIEPILIDLAPDWIVIYGDTNSTLAAALAASKIGQRSAHLEAGLRSFNRSMPEEHNRVLADHAADLLLAPTSTAMANLSNEGLGGRSLWVGDVMADICLAESKAVDAFPPSIGLPDGDFVFATLHRPSNTDNDERLRSVIEAMSTLPLPVVLAAHPRLVSKAARAGIPLYHSSLTVISPLAYRDLVWVLKSARAVITDSGGIQKEAYLLGTPCTTLRHETEWAETLEQGWNALCSDNLGDLEATTLRPIPTGGRPPHYGLGNASELVVDALLESG